MLESKQPVVDWVSRIQDSKCYRLRSLNYFRALLKAIISVRPICALP